MKKEPRISVVIPALNEEKYIGATLFHLAHQKPYEIIIADSFSTDRTVKIAKKFGCRIVNCKKGSASIGRNAGAKAARGDVLLFMDADTIAFSNLIEELKKDFRLKKTVGWTCPVYAFSPKWKEHLMYNAFNNLAEFLIKYAKKPHAAGIVVAARKSAYAKVGGFDENLKLMEDHDFAMKLGKTGNFTFSKKTCVFTSTRRIDKWGGWNLFKRYSKYYLSYFINKKKFYSSNQKVRYEPIR